MNSRLTLGVLFFWTASILRAESWQQTYDALAQQPGQARTAFDFLKRQPLEIKQTLEFQISMARAARAVEDPMATSRALTLIYLIFKPSPAPDLEEVRLWLSQRGLKLHELAIKLLEKGDEEGAAKKYLGAVRCEQAVLGFNDRHLRMRAETLLDAAVKAHPDDADGWCQLAFYCYFFGRPDAAKEALQKATSLQKDPYLLWVYEQGLKVLSKEPPRAAAPSPEPAASPSAAVDPVAAQYALERMKQLDEELKKLGPEPSAAPTPKPGEQWKKVKSEFAQRQKVWKQLGSDLKMLVITSPRAGFK